MKRAILCFLFFFFFLFFILVLTLAGTLPTDKKNAVGSVSEINVSKDFFVLSEKQISGHHFNDLHFIQVKNNPRSCKVNLCNCVRSLKKIQDFNEIPFFLFFFFQGYIAFTIARNILHMISFPQFSYMTYFHVHLSLYISSSSQKS